MPWPHTFRQPCKCGALVFPYPDQRYLFKGPFIFYVCYVYWPPYYRFWLLFSGSFLFCFLVLCFTYVTLYLVKTLHKCVSVCVCFPSFCPYDEKLVYGRKTAKEWLTNVLYEEVINSFRPRILLDICFLWRTGH